MPKTKWVFVARFWLTWFVIFLFLAELATEKAQQAVLKGVEDFDPSVLKHAETQEKVVLPDAEGILKNCYFVSKTSVIAYS